MRIFIILFLMVLILFGVSFAVLNASTVVVNFYFTQFKMPVSALIIITLGIGMLLGILVFVIKYWRLKIEYHKLKNQLKITEKEIKNLRSIPLQDQH